MKIKTTDLIGKYGLFNNDLQRQLYVRIEDGEETCTFRVYVDPELVNYDDIEEDLDAILYDHVSSMSTEFAQYFIKNRNRISKALQTKKIERIERQIERLQKELDDTKKVPMNFDIVKDQYRDYIKGQAEYHERQYTKYKETVEEYSYHKEKFDTYTSILKSINDNQEAED